MIAVSPISCTCEFVFNVKHDVLQCVQPACIIVVQQKNCELRDMKNVDVVTLLRAKAAAMNQLLRLLMFEMQYDGSNSPEKVICPCM